MKNSQKKSLTLLVSILVLVCVTVGGTLAFLITQTAPVINTFTPSNVTVEINETFDGNVKENVSVKNTGDTKAYIRAAVVVTWQDEDGNVYPQAPVADTDYTITYNLNQNNGWIQGSDGFYYWTNPVAAGANTGVLITNAQLVEGATPPEGYYLCIDILASGIQAEPSNAVVEAWGVSVDENGTINVN